MFKWFRQPALDPLSVSMAGAKLGDRILVVGCSDPRLIAALAIKAGLSGRAVAVDESPALATEAGRIALKEGALVETSVAAPHALEFEAESFDSVVLRDPTREARSLASIVAQAFRVLRPGGRCMIIDTVGRGGLSSMLGAPAPPDPAGGTQDIEAFKRQGFVAVRILAERDGLRFIEAVKKNG